MKRNSAWLIVVASIACLQLTGCAQPSAATDTAEDKPVKIEHLEGTDPTRVILTDEAATRLDLQTESPRDVIVGGIRQREIPYAAIVYDTEGHAWTYTNPEPLTYLRHPITVDHISGDEAIVSEGLATNTAVVTVGAVELFGSESEFAEE